MYFNSDDEFYDFCVNPQIVARELNVKNNGTPLYAFDWNFTDQYNKALEENKIFIIKDEDSKIYKHGAVTYKTITKPIKNLEQYIKRNIKNKK
jgi:hypothetical protein